MSRKWNKIAAIGLKKVLDFPCHKVRVYSDRLAIWRKDGRNLTWDELQVVKGAVWGENAVAVEVYPAQRDVINKKNTRHLWSTIKLRNIVKTECKHPEFLKRRANHNLFLRFECPKCGSYMFGSTENADGTFTRQCHGNEQWRCDFEFHESEDKKYFKTLKKLNKR